MQIISTRIKMTWLKKSNYGESEIPRRHHDIIKNDIKQ